MAHCVYKVQYVTMAHTGRDYDSVSHSQHVILKILGDPVPVWGVLYSKTWLISGTCTNLRGQRRKGRNVISISSVWGSKSHTTEPKFHRTQFTCQISPDLVI